MIRCDTHGSLPWNGDVVCACCDRVYRDGGTDFCRCGARLRPDPESSSVEFSARAICPECYEQRMRQAFEPTPAPEPATGPHPALSGPHKTLSGPREALSGPREAPTPPSQGSRSGSQ